MEGADASDLYKNTHPLPREHNDSTRIFVPPGADEIVNGEMRNWDLRAVCTSLFRSAQFTKLVEMQCSSCAIGRSGEVKFLNFQRMFFDATFNMLLGLYWTIVPLMNSFFFSYA